MKNFTIKLKYTIFLNDFLRKCFSTSAAIFTPRVEILEKEKENLIKTHSNHEDDPIEINESKIESELIQLNEAETKELEDNIENDKEKPKKKLPNLWDLVDHFIKDQNNIKYCSEQKTFYLYENKFWRMISEHELGFIFINNFLKKKYKDRWKQFNAINMKHVLETLSYHESFGNFSMEVATAEVNEKGVLLPFLNGVLNLKTLKLLKHSKENYRTHLIIIDYKKQDTIKGTIIEKWLKDITCNNENRLKVLRAFLYCIFTNNTSYQVALYIYGPAGSGKSTLIDMLSYLLGTNSICSTTISQLNSRFGTHVLIGKQLIILNDISLFRGQESQIIKNMISGDAIQGEAKYKQPITFTPRSLVLISSNTVWDIKTPTTGIARRMIYMPFDYVPEEKELNLIVVSRSGLASGPFVKYLGGFLNWILDCPQKDIDLLKTGGTNLTKLCGSDLVITDPLRSFVEDALYFRDQEDMPFVGVAIGNKESNWKTLYGAYSLWCRLNGLNPMGSKSFSILLYSLLISMHWKIEKKRTATCTYIMGVQINLDWLNEAKETYMEQRKTKRLAENSQNYEDN